MDVDQDEPGKSRRFPRRLRGVPLARLDRSRVYSIAFVGTRWEIVDWQPVPERGPGPVLSPDEAGYSDEGAGPPSASDRPGWVETPPGRHRGSYGPSRAL